MKYINKTVWLSLLIGRIRRNNHIPSKGNKIWDSLQQAEKHKHELESNGYWATIQHMASKDNFQKIEKYNVLWWKERKGSDDLPDGYSNINGDHRTIYPDE